MKPGEGGIVGETERQKRGDEDLKGGKEGGEEEE